MSICNTNPRTKCSACASGYAYDTEIAKDVSVRHNGKEHTVHIPAMVVSKCDACGEVYLDNRADDQIQEALRSHLGVLTHNQRGGEG